MLDHLTLFLIQYYLFIPLLDMESFFKITNKEMLSFNVGYIGIAGFFFISLISIFSSFFLPIIICNLIIHGIGIISFLTFNEYKKDF